MSFSVLKKQVFSSRHIIFKFSSMFFGELGKVVEATCSVIVNERFWKQIKKKFLSEAVNLNKHHSYIGMCLLLRTV